MICCCGLFSLEFINDDLCVFWRPYRYRKRMLEEEEAVRHIQTHVKKKLELQKLHKQMKEMDESVERVQVSAQNMDTQFEL